MSKFNFRLDAALQWRSAQLKAQELQLQNLLREQAVVEQRLQALALDFERAAENAKSDTACGGASLAAYSRYRLSCMKLKASLTSRLDQVAAAIQNQKRAVMQSKRDYELLVKLEKREFQLWETERNRTIESNAAESFLIRWNRK
jgi:hypothetical protein